MSTILILKIIKILIKTDKKLQADAVQSILCTPSKADKIDELKFLYPN